MEIWPPRFAEPPNTHKHRSFGFTRAPRRATLIASERAGARGSCSCRQEIIAPRKKCGKMRPGARSLKKYKLAHLLPINYCTVPSLLLLIISFSYFLSVVLFIRTRRLRPPCAELLHLLLYLAPSCARRPVDRRRQQPWLLLSISPNISLPLVIIIMCYLLYLVSEGIFPAVIILYMARPSHTNETRVQLLIPGD